MISRSTAALAAASTVVAALLTGCTAPAPATPSASATATSDKALTLYSGRNEALVKPVVEQFEAATGIKVTVRYAGTAELAALLVEEGKSTPAHVFLAQDAGALGVVAKEGLTTVLPAATTDKVAATYRDDKGRWVGVTGRSRVLAYDSRVLTPAALPASVLDLTKPEWKGKVGVAPTNASFQSFVTALRVKLGEAKASEFLTGLKANDPQVRTSNGVIVADIEAGRLPVGLVNHYYLGERAREQGTSIDALHTKLHFFADGDLGGLVNVSGAALTVNQPDADAAAFVEYLLGTQAQTYFATKTFEYPLAAGVAGPVGFPPLASLHSPDLDLNDLDTLAASVKLIKEAGLA